MKNIILSFLFFLSINISDVCHAQWMQTSNGIGNSASIHDVTAIGNNLFAVAYGTGVYKSTNNGLNWSLTFQDYQYVLSITALGNNVIVGGTAGKVYISTNYGANWTLNNSPIRNISSLFVVGTNLYSGSDFGIHYSSNGGTNWTEIGFHYFGAYPITVLGSKIFTGLSYSFFNHNDSLGIYYTTNNGLSWIKTGLDGKRISSLSVIGNNLFAGTDSCVYLSSNEGINWLAINNGIANAYELKATGTNLFAISSNGVFLSKNNGANWINRNQGFTFNVSTVGSLFINSSYIFAGTYNNSIWRRDYNDIIGISKISSEIPSSYSLKQNYPNPFNPLTKIRYSIPQNTIVKLKIFDIIGKEVETLVNEKQNPGTYEVSFDASKYPSGIYFYKLETENYSEIKKMVLIK